MKLKNKIKIISLAALMLSLCYTAKAQSKFTNGTIVSSESATIRTNAYASSKAYDTNVFGVYYKAPNTKTSPYFKINPFKSVGIYYIRCNNSNGAIHKGDLITSSSTSGVGMKATKSGMIVGVALQDASGGKVKARILIQYVHQ